MSYLAAAASKEDTSPKSSSPGSASNSPTRGLYAAPNGSEWSSADHYSGQKLSPTAGVEGAPPAPNTGFSYPSLPLPPSPSSGGPSTTTPGGAAAPSTGPANLDAFLSNATSSLNVSDPPKSPSTTTPWDHDEVNANATEYVPTSYDYTGGYGAQGWGYQDAAVPVQPPQGIFYMAVNVGGQQVLQPVQIVQLPNGQMATVLANPPGMADPTGAYGAGIGGVGGWDDGKRRKKRDGLKHSPDLSPLHIDTPADLAVDIQSNELQALYGSARRPALKELLGNVRRLSKDQVGCRLLQQSLDEDGPEAATEIITEALPFMAEIMTDPFGNYLFQKILEKCVDEERLDIIRAVSPSLVKSSLNLHGTRSVQKVVEIVAGDAAAAQLVTAALAPQAARLCIDANGNHVIQRVLQRLPHSHGRFVFDAVAAAVGEVARHRHGCCVIQRCLDSPPSGARSNLVARIVEKALELMQDAYGNYVVQYVLDVCSEEEAAAVCVSVVGRVGMLAIQKFSSNVMEKCLEKADEKTQELYLRELSHPDSIKDLMSDPFGNYVVQRGLAVSTHAQAVRLVEAMRPHLSGMRNTAGGRRIVSKICRRFPNFNAEVQHGMKGQQHQHQQQHQQHQQPQHQPQPQQQQGAMGQHGPE